MPDPRFFEKQGPFSLARLAVLGEATLAGDADPETLIADVGPLETADSQTLSFLDNRRYVDAFSATQAGACFVAPNMAVLGPPGTALLVTDTPYKAYALAAQAFYPTVFPGPRIAETARIAPDAVLGEGCVVEDGAVIGSRAEIGAGCWIEAGAVIGAGVVLGPGCRVGALASVSHSLIGAAVRLYPGCRIGQDGFGFAIDPAGHVKVPQLGRVLIGDYVEIGANTTIDRGAGPDTVIGDGTWIDNLVQIGHNVRIGRGCVIVAQVGVSGSAVIEDYAVLAGQAGIAGHLRVGKGAQVGAQAGVMRDIPAGDRQVGSPAMPVKQFMRQVAALGRLAGGGRG